MPSVLFFTLQSRTILDLIPLTRVTRHSSFLTLDGRALLDKDYVPSSEQSSRTPGTETRTIGSPGWRLATPNVEIQRSRAKDHSRTRSGLLLDLFSATFKGARRYNARSPLSLLSDDSFSLFFGRLGFRADRQARPTKRHRKRGTFRDCSPRSPPTGDPCTTTLRLAGRKSPSSLHAAGDEMGLSSRTAAINMRVADALALEWCR